jgi:hypothetical protein
MMVCEPRQLQNACFQPWHGHLAREIRAVFHEMPQGITGKMPVPRYFASPSNCIANEALLEFASE